MRVNSERGASLRREAYYVTKCVEGRRPLLANPDSAEAIIDSLVFARAKGRIKLLAFVVMPDHYHVLLTLMPGEELSMFMLSMGSFTANRIRDLLGYRGVVWQRDGYYEHRCRNESEVLDYAAYIHHNPVRKGLVDREEDWIASMLIRVEDLCSTGNGGREFERSGMEPPPTNDGDWSPLLMKDRGTEPPPMRD